MACCGYGRQSGSGEESETREDRAGPKGTNVYKGEGGINREAEVLGNDFLSELRRGIMVTDRPYIQGAQGLAH